MSLQWLSVAAFLYTEIGLGLLLCLGFISNARWQSIFTSRLLALCRQGGNFLFSAFVLLLAVLFIDSAFQTKKYSHLEVSHLDLRNNPQAEVQAHMKLFRAQRNLYITGFSLFMLLVLRRLATLISTLATLEASHEAICKQAKGASEQAKKLMDENEKLRKDNRAESATVEGQEDTEELNKQISELKEKLQDSDMSKCQLGCDNYQTLKKFTTQAPVIIKSWMENNLDELTKSEKDFTALKGQSEGLSKEYDRLLEEYTQTKKKLSIVSDEFSQQDDSKKDN